MMLFPLFNRGYHILINLLQTISHLQVRHSPLIRTNTPITTHPTNLQSATVTETADHTRGLTTLWNGMNSITMFPPPPTITPSPFHLRDPRDPPPFKHNLFQAVPIITKG